MTAKSSINKHPISRKSQSPFLRPRNKSKSKSKSKPNKQTLHFEQQSSPSHSSSRVFDQQEEEDYDDDDVTTSEQLGFKASSKDLVWAKAFPLTWWPGYKQREYRGKFLVSFFNCDKELWFHESEMKDFEADFKEMIAKRRFEAEALDSALEEFGRRLSVESMCCCCREEVEDIVDVKIGFEAVDVLGFVRRVGVCASFEEVESVNVVRDSAYVNAFRRCAFIKRDWIYDETMRVAEYDDILRPTDGVDAEDFKAVLMDTRSEGETKGSVSQQVGEENEEVEEEREAELEHGEELEEEGEGTLRQIWDQVKNGSVMKMNKEQLELDRDYFIQKPQITENEVFLPGEALAFVPVEALAFVRRLAISPSVDDKDSDNVNRAAAQVSHFRRYLYNMHDRLYQDITMLSGNTNELEDNTKNTRSEGEMKGFVSRQVGEVDEEVEEQREVKLEHADELKEEGEGTLREIWEQVKNGSVTKKNKEPLEQKYFIERAQITENEVLQPDALAFAPVEALGFVRRLAIFPWGDDIDSDDVIRAAAQVSCFRRYLCEKHDLSYKDTTRHSGSTNELEDNTIGVSTEDEKRVVQAVRLSDVEEENGHEPIFEEVRSGLVICKTVIEYPLHDILNHLFCLAIDPFYFGAEKRGANCLDGACEKILRYRKMVYQCPSLRRSFYRDSVAEMSKVHEFSKGCSTSHHRDLPMEENSCVVDDEVNQESELLSDLWNKHKKRPRVGEKTEDEKVNCSISNIEDVTLDLVRGNGDSNYEFGNKMSLEHKDVNGCVSAHNVDGKDIVDLTKDVHDCEVRFESNKRQKIGDVEVRGRSNGKGEDGFDVSRDIPDCNRVSKSNKRQKFEDVKVSGRSNVKREDDFDISRDTPDCNLVSKSIKRQKISMYESGSHVQGGSTKTLEGQNSVFVHDDIPGSKPSLHVCKDHLNAEHYTEAGTNGRNADLKVGCRSDHVSVSLPDGTLSGKIISSQHEDTVGGAFSQGPDCGDVSPDNIVIHHSFGAAVDSSNRVRNIQKVHGGPSERNANPSKNSNNRTAKIQEPKMLQPLTMLYLSPLSAESPASSSNSQFQLRKAADAHSEHPATLHMKFPKDYKLPSKDELVKKFRPFGPIDYLKTKVFFYTGSAQVGFLQHHDAEAACRYAKKKNIFVGGANIRFWLDQREQSRSGFKNVSLPTSLPTGRSLASDLRPCLKVSNPLGNKIDRKDLRVKFPSNGQVLPSVSFKTNTRVFTQSDSCRYNNAVSPDISLEMIELLEKCNQTVTKIKDSLGLQSFYSLFTHNYCHLGFDEG